MKSLFPGMDPYLERRSRWLGFHNRFLTDIERALVRGLPDHYVTELEERLVIDDGGRYRADLSVWELDEPPQRPPSDAGGVAVMEATRTAPMAKEIILEAPEWFLTVFTQDGELVTTIELLSWSNKLPGKDRDAFVKRREELTTGPSNYVEIDLLRGGKPPSSEQYDDTHDLPHDYIVTLHEESARPVVGFWPISIRDRLPTIAIPLRPPDRPVMVDLQAAFEETFAVGRYAPRVYRQEVRPPLKDGDAEWAAGLLKEAGIEVT